MCLPGQVSGCGLTCRPGLCCRYGLRYTARVLRDSLQAKFPGASEEELYKVSTWCGSMPEAWPLTLDL